MTVELQSLREKIGQRQTSHDVVTASQVGRMASALGVSPPAQNPGDELPAGWHDGFFPSLAPLNALREDGQPKSGGIMPAVPLPQRRLAGVRTKFLASIVIGDQITKTTEVGDVRIEDADTHPTVTVTIRDTIESTRGKAVVEERDFQFFSSQSKSQPFEFPPLPDNPTWSETITPTPVMLFRSSAARFNSHRVHYDRDYVTNVEGFPGLVVPVSLAGAMMLGTVRRELPDKTLTTFSFRSIRRLYDNDDFHILGSANESTAQFWATNHHGDVAVVSEIAYSG